MTQKTIRLHEHLFYERPLSLSAEQIEKLRQQASVESSYGKYRGPKKCGAFHPDYCLVWEDGKKAFHAQFCLGCSEVKIFAAGEQLLVEFNNENEEFKNTLKQHVAQRPQKPR